MFGLMLVEPRAATHAALFNRGRTRIRRSRYQVIDFRTLRIADGSLLNPSQGQDQSPDEIIGRDRGSIPRDLLDHVIVMGEAHLRQLLRACTDYDNTYRTHLGLNQDTPLGRPVQHRGRIASMPKLGGLHHAYGRI